MEKRKKNKNERKDRASSKNSESQTEHGPKNERMNKVSSKNSESQTEHGPKNERMNKVSSKNSESQTEHGPKNERMDKVSSKNSESQTEHGPKNERKDRVSSKNSESQTEHGPKNERKDRVSSKNSESQTEHGPKNERKDRVSSKNSESQTEHGQIVPTKGITKTDQALPHLLILSLADYFVGTDLRYIKLTSVFWKREFHLLQQAKSTLSFGLSMELQLLTTNNCSSTLNLRILFFSNHTNAPNMVLDLKSFILDVALVVHPTELARTTLVLNAPLNINTNVLDQKTIMLNALSVLMLPVFAKYLVMPSWIREKKYYILYIVKIWNLYMKKQNFSWSGVIIKNAGKEPRRKDFYREHFHYNPQPIFAYPALYDTRLHINRVYNLNVKEFKKEFVRLQTFKTFPRNAEQYPIMLAANGFINTGFDVTDKTTCFYCMKSYENWRYTDDIKSIHLRISPTCPMAIGLKCVNVPISTQKMITFHSAVSTNHEDLPMESRSIESLTLNSQIPEVGENFNRSHEASSSVQDTNQAGGFQVSDQFAEGSETALPVCFYCNVPDSYTDNGQDIMVKHIINSPSCGYVKLQMGHNYVETVLELATQQSQITEQMIRDRMNLPIAVGDRMNLPGDARDRMNLPRDARDRINLPRAIAFYPVTGGRYLQPGLTRAQVPHSGNISDLQAEYNWRLSRLICEICQRKDVQVIFIPCGHVITCVECSLLQEFCNSCHSHIEGKTRIFFE
ncbi:uncharacterized protein LOC106078841 isoform X3 [Biomphalaria glabrata]|uniref:Uncharacterized protein LOC106078841 isoform X3 n=1 Tax=Biomphalaria glabrata TaxID=6526 RepID=A0A9W3A6N9_BIOGL|nr:uncharacterized protein LOC106078841 isoform X3 [Biomphalaria glabrata]